MKKIRISPSILSADFSNLGKLIVELERAGADSLHLDVMDGHFVRNITFGPVVVKSIRKLTKLPLEVHLMIENPDMYVERFAEAGADMLIIHMEVHCNIADTIARIKAKGMKAGLALSPETGLHGALEFLAEADQLLVMTVSPGFGGQAFISECLGKIGEARRYIDEKGLKTVIAVDGGIKADTGRLAVEAGADELVAGTAIVNSKDMTSAIASLKGSDSGGVERE
jgi:ribulose-phosphate 3-epimerase